MTGSTAGENTDGMLGRVAAQSPSVLEKTRRLIDALGAHDEPIGPSALARAVSLPKSTVYRLCQELAEWGVVERYGTGFQLASGAAALAVATSDSRRFRETATPFAVELYAMTRLTSTLSLLSGTDVVLADKVHGTRDTGTWLYQGLRAPVHSSSAGRAILAFSPLSLLSSIVARPLVRTTPRSLVSPQALRRELWGIRRRGLAISRDEVRLGQGALAAPVFGADGRVIGALTVSAPSPDIGSPAVERALMSQAQALSMTLRSA
jgi:DNA-binding IclR family transcriptional regulator